MPMYRLSPAQHQLLKKIMFLRMEEFCDRQHTTGGFAILLFGKETLQTEDLFQKLFGEVETNRCRTEWRKIVKIGSEAYHRNLAEEGYDGSSFGVG